MTAVLASYLAAARAAIAAGGKVEIARLATLWVDQRALHAEPSAEVVALLDGEALDLPAPDAAPEVIAWQEDVRDTLLRATVAAVGDLGWLTVHDEPGSTRVRVRFVPAPQLHAAAANASPPPALAPDRLTAALSVDVDARADALLALAPASLSDDACALVASALAPHGRAAGDVTARVFAAPVWWVPPPPPPAPPRRRTTEPPPLPRSPDEDWIRLELDPDGLRISSGQHGDVLAHESRRAGVPYRQLEIPIARLFEIHPVPSGVPHQAWLRLSGCFHDLGVRGEQDGITFDLGPLPAAIAGAEAAKLRRLLGLPRPIDPLLSTQGLLDRDVVQWVEVLGTWSPGIPGAPDFDGLYLRLPRHGVAPRPGGRLRVRGLFVGPLTLYALAWEAW